MTRAQRPARSWWPVARCQHSGLPVSTETRARIGVVALDLLAADERGLGDRDAWADALIAAVEEVYPDETSAQ